MSRSGRLIPDFVSVVGCVSNPEGDDVDATGWISVLDGGSVVDCAVVDVVVDEPGLEVETVVLEALD